MQFKTRGIYSPQLWGSKVWNKGLSKARLFLKALGENPFLASSSFMEMQLLAFLGLWPHLFLSCLPISVFSVCLCCLTCLSLVRVMAFKTYLNNLLIFCGYWQNGFKFSMEAQRAKNSQYYIKDKIVWCVCVCVCVSGCLSVCVSVLVGTELKPILSKEG
jgi:hypothetical protein